MKTITTASWSLLLLAILTGCPGIKPNCVNHQFGRNVRDGGPDGSQPSPKPMTGWLAQGPDVIKTVTNLESAEMSLTYTPVGGTATKVEIPSGGTTTELAGQSGNGFVSIQRVEAFITERGDGADVRFCLAEEQPSKPPTLPPTPLPNDAGSNRTPFAAVKIPEAWEFMKGRWQRKSASDSGWPGVVVVDDGFFSHPDLGIRPDLLPGFIGGTSEGRQVPLPAFGAHGTGVISLIGADVNNNSGIAGVAGARRTSDGETVGGCWRIPARADGLLGPGLGMSPAALAAAIEHWIQHLHVRIINVSQSVIELSGGSGLVPSFRNAQAKGVLIVIGAGNDKKVRNERGVGGWLKSFDNVLIVGGLNHGGTALWNGPAKGTATGSAIDVYAPAEDLMAIVSPTTVDKVSGTSYATPLVSGVAAMMLNVKPSLSPAQIRRIIMRTADQLSTGADSDVRRLNAYGAVVAASRPLSIPNP